MTGLETKNNRVINGGIFTRTCANRKNKKHRIQRRSTEEKPMTVCIAAIAEANTEFPKIVIAADREVTSWISYTSGVGKIRVLTSYCWVMISTNNALMSDDIITKSLEKVNELSKNKPDEKLTIEQIVDIISKECKRKLDIERERFVLSPHGLSYNSYIGKSREFSREHIEILTDDLRGFETDNYDFTAEFLVVGIDSKPHIFTIIQNGQYVSSDIEGFAVAGGGKATAFPEITKYAYFPALPWLTALVRVYTSKKVAERVGGVGPDTDLIVLHKMQNGGIGIWVTDEDTIKLLNKGIADIRDKEIEIWTDSLKELSTKFVPASNE